MCGTTPPPLHSFCSSYNSITTPHLNFMYSFKPTESTSVIHMHMSVWLSTGTWANMRGCILVENRPSPVSFSSQCLLSHSYMDSGSLDLVQALCMSSHWVHVSELTCATALPCAESILLLQSCIWWNSIWLFGHITVYEIAPCWRLVLHGDSCT